MEITLPRPPLYIPPTKPSSSQKLFPPSTPSFPANSHHHSIQINLPLHRPQKPIPKTFPKPLKHTPINPCSISDSLRLFDILGIPVTADIYLFFIGECSQSRDQAQAIAVHNHIRTSRIRPTLSIYNRLLLMYVSCGCTLYAKKLFDKMSVRSLSSWASLIAGCCDNGEYEEVLDMFVEMRGWKRTRVEGGGGDMDRTAACVILGCVLKACGETMELEVGKQAHCLMVKMGCARNLVLHRSLMSFYGKLGRVFQDSD